MADDIKHLNKAYSKVAEGRFQNSYQLGDRVLGPFGLARITALNKETGACLLKQLEDFGDNEIKPGYEFKSSTFEIRPAKEVNPELEGYENYQV